MGNLHKDSQPRYITPGVKVMPVPEGENHRDQARFHINMIMGETYVSIVDRGYKKSTGMLRRMRLDVRPMVISESTYADIFNDVTLALHQSGNMAQDEMAACITYPAGTTERFVESNMGQA